MSEPKAPYTYSGLQEQEFDFDESDNRNMWLVMGAIYSLNLPTSSAVAKTIGISESRVIQILLDLNGPQYLDTAITSVKEVLKIENWGVIRQDVIENYFLKFIAAKSLIDEK